MNFEPRVPFTPFFLGRGVHKALEDHYSEGIPAATAFIRWTATAVLELEDVEMSDDKRAELMESVVLGAGMLAHYDMWSAARDAEFKMLRPEYTIHVPLGFSVDGREVFFAGRADGVVEDTKGDLWLKEFKTTAQMGSFNLEYDSQAYAYLQAARISPDFPIPDRKPVGTIFTFLRKKVPNRPDVITRGLSKNKRQGTSYHYYMKEIVDRGLNPGDYTEILAHLKENVPYFVRERLRPSGHALQIQWENLHKVAREMLDPHVPIYPNTFGWQCKSCIFREPCQAVWRGLDPWPLLQTDYRVRPSSAEEVEE